MFDDPGKELRRLEDALREETAAEEPDELDEVDELDLEALLEERPAPRRDFSRTVYDEPTDDTAMVPDNDPKPKGIGWLVVLAFLELAGIVAVALWWVKWVL